MWSFAVGAKSLQSWMFCKSRDGILLTGGCKERPSYRILSVDLNHHGHFTLVSLKNSQNICSINVVFFFGSLMFDVKITGN